MANLKDLEIVAKEMLGKLKSNQLFQSKWDAAYVVIFLIVLGTILLLLLLICLNCCCSPCCCCHCCCRCCRRCFRCCCRCCRSRSCCGPHHPSRSQTMSAKQENSMGLSNLALEP